MKFKVLDICKGCLEAVLVNKEKHCESCAK